MVSGIKDINWKIRYRSAQDNLLADFYIPALGRSVLYQRSAGYFSTASLMIAAKGIIHLINNKGKMRLVVSPHFTKEDIVAIEEGYKKKEEVIKEILERDFPNPEVDFIKKRLEATSWMIAKGLLEIKIACPTKNKKIIGGLYHEKMAIFTDSNGDYIVSSGSNNESENAYIHNFESFDVQCSWLPGLSSELATTKKQEFEELWNNETTNLEIFTIPEAIKERILKMCPSKAPERYSEEDNIPEIKKPNEIDIPTYISLREHQQTAIDEWFKNNSRGLIQHATGSGKTITALSMAVKLYEKLGNLAIVILCPQKHLVDQWSKEAEKFGFKPIKGYNNSSVWYPILNRNVLQFNMGIKKQFVFITTNSSFSMQKTIEVIENIKKDFLIVGDEAHNLGAPHLGKCLVQNAKFRIGLSATPERWHDEEGTATIISYFGKTLKPIYEIKDAIRDGHLCEYLFYPHLVNLTPEENEEYHELTEKISRLSNYDRVQEEFTNSPLSNLLFKRARLIGKAHNKLVLLKELMENYKDSYFNLFYCGDGKVEEEKQIEKVSKTLGLELDMKIAQFTANENSTTRKAVLNQLKNKQLQGLVAIRCLDEGVDVPSIKRAFILASSTNPRQFIQRRGRVLRNPEGENSKVAEIHDFIVIPSDIELARNMHSSTFNIERKLIKKELLRFSEFAETAKNGPQAHGVILKIKELYNLLDI